MQIMDRLFAVKRVDKDSLLFSNKQLMQLVLPLIAEQLLSIFVGLADSIMIASVGEAAVSGVSLIDSIMILLTCLFSALATGGAVVAGQYLGRRELDSARKASDELVWFSALCAFVMMALIYVFQETVIRTIFGRIDADVYYHANVYMSIVNASIPMIAIYNACAAIFRTMGNSKKTLEVAVIMNVVNIIGNAILIYGCKMGTAGVAIPTLISRAVAAVIGVVLLLRPEYELHITKKLIHRFDWRCVKRILHIGIPNGLENSMFQVGKLILMSLIATLGTSAITANSVTGVLASFEVMTGAAVSLAVTTVVARCVGAGNYDQARYYTGKLMAITYAALWICDIIIIATLEPVLKIYHLSALTAQLTRESIICHTLGTVIFWPIAFPLPCAFRAAGDVKFAMIVSILSMWFCRLMAAYVFVMYFDMGVMGTWAAMVTDWVVRAIVFGTRFVGDKWQQYKLV